MKRADVFRPDGPTYAADQWLRAVSEGRLLDVWSATHPDLRAVLVDGWANHVADQAPAHAADLGSPALRAELCRERPSNPWWALFAVAIGATVLAALRAGTANTGRPGWGEDPRPLALDAEAVVLVNAHGRALLSVVLVRQAGTWLVAGVGPTRAPFAEALVGANLALTGPISA